MELGDNQAFRITSGQGAEVHADISPDGKLVAFSAEYDGPREVYVMDIDGGLPRRLTYEGESANVIGWTPDNKVLYSTRHYSTLPNVQLVEVDPRTLEVTIVPLAQASDGVYTSNRSQLFFVRQPFQGSQTKRYTGGTAQNLWMFDSFDEAKPLTTFYAGTTKNPLITNSRLFFLSDNDGTMNLFSKTLDDQVGWTQHTFSKGWDLKEPDAYRNNIIYQKGADLALFNLSNNTEEVLNISLQSDQSNQLKRWITDPINHVSSINITEEGNSLIVTARGRVFSIPVKEGRFIEVNKAFGVRHRKGRILPGTEEVLFLSDQSGEVEIWSADKLGLAVPTQITRNSKVLIMDFLPSPDGSRIAYWDKDFDLRVVDSKSGEATIIDHSKYGGYPNMSWSPDSQWLAFTKATENTNVQIHLFNVEGNARKVATTDRLDSYDPVWSPDSKWLYFLSDRDFQTIVRGPWGPRQPEPFYDETTRVFALDLTGNGDFPFDKETELKETKETDTRTKRKLVYANQSDPLNLNDLESRLYAVPLAGKNRTKLAVNEQYLFWVEIESTFERHQNLYSYKISDKSDSQPILLASKVKDYKLSGDGKSLLIWDDSGLYITQEFSEGLNKTDTRVELDGWKIPLNPKDEWKQMFVDSWRLMRDYFYDKNMHGVDWKAELKKHLPLVSRVGDRQELDDLIAHMVGELSALHTFVRSRDVEKTSFDIEVASLGAIFERNLNRGGYVIKHIYKNDPDYPETLSPLAKPYLRLNEGDVLTKIDGVSVLSVSNIGELLLSKTDVEVRLSLKSQSGDTFDEIVKPIDMEKEQDLRYSEWELTRREMVEEGGNNEIGYFHLRAMSGRNFIEFVKGFYPSFHKKGLIIDARHNRGGNIDSWVLEKLMRKAWMYWQPREGEPYWNMQYAFRGHMVMLVDERTASDGEALAEGFRRLDLGDVIGTRTWGGEIWLTSSNRLVDNGIASAAEFGVYGPEGRWLIEGWGLEPDQVVDNLPHETFRGEDKQLKAAIEHLLKKISEEPVDVPPAPPHPDKSFDYDENQEQ